LLDGKGPKHQGVCTSFFDSSPAVDVPCFVKPAMGFRLPRNPSDPVIMIGAGSGIAPLRAFWQERDVQMQNGTKCGPMLLFFGCRQAKVDNIYATELNDVVERGILTDVFLALSREPDQKKVLHEHVFQKLARDMRN